MTSLQTSASPLRYWILAARPKTLTAALVPILTTTAFLAARQFEIDWLIAAVTLLCALSIQVATNFFNDVIDFKKGADTEERLGPLRVTQSGKIKMQHLEKAAFFILLVAFALGIFLVFKGGWPIVLIGVLSLFFAYGYTGGPFPLAYLGLGDLFVILFFGVVAVAGYGYLQTTTMQTGFLVLGLQIGFYCTVLIAINNFRDMFSDSRVGKKTLPVRFGKTFARYEIAFLILAPVAMNIYWVFSGFWPVAVCTAFLWPLSFNLIKAVFAIEPSQELNRLLGKSALLHFGFGALASLGFFLC
jgi:1,4-dihydroxy-2-naphthoate octaprenyltransferase